MRIVGTLLLLMVLSVGTTSSQDFMTPNSNIESELSKITTNEERIKTMDEEIKQLKRQKEEQQQTLEALCLSIANANSRIDELLPKIKAYPDPCLITSLQSDVYAFKSRLSLLQGVSDFVHFKKVGQKYYVANGQKHTFNNSVKFCSDQNATLVLPRTAEENKALASMQLILGAEYIFLALTDRKIEGIFLDMNDKPPVYTNWNENEPNDYFGREDCVGLHRTYIWNDLPCEHSYHVVCELN